MSARPKLTLTSVTDGSVTPQPAPAETKPPAPETSVAESPAATTPSGGSRGARSDPATAARPASRARPADEPEMAAELDSGPWRSWNAFVHPVGFKWPAELAEELDDRRHDLREPVGLMVVAAVTHLLDQDDETIRRLIDRAEEAKPRDGRRRRK